MKKKKLRAKLSSTKEKLAKAESKVSELESQLLAAAVRSRKTRAAPKKTAIRKPAAAKTTNG